MAVRLVLALTVLCTAGFCAVAYAVSRGWTDGMDHRLMLFLRDQNDRSGGWGPPWLEETVIDLTALGGYPNLVAVSLLVMGAVLVARKWEAAVYLSITLVGGSLLSSGLKAVIQRPRPDLFDHLDRTFTSSFPSAHSMVSMIVWLTLASLAGRFIADMHLRAYLYCSAVVLAIIVGLSRIYLGVHWPSDVLAGWFAGAGWAGTCWLAVHFLAHERRTIDREGSSR